MTHLSRDIRLSAIDLLSWLIGTAGLELVSSQGGWYQTLQCFTTVLAWRVSDVDKWTTSTPTGGDNKYVARIVTVLAELLELGLIDHIPGSEALSLAVELPLWHAESHRTPVKSNAYAYLNLFGPPQDLTERMLEDCEDRIKVYNDHFRILVESGVSQARKEGGECGRAAGLLSKVLERAHLDAYD
jgi:pre-rRNA-processing protein IPI1